MAASEPAQVAVDHAHQRRPSFAVPLARGDQELRELAGIESFNVHIPPFVEPRGDPSRIATDDDPDRSPTHRIDAWRTPDGALDQNSTGRPHRHTHRDRRPRLRDG